MIKRGNIRSMTFAAVFSALIAMGAFLRIPIPMMDYFTLQFLFVVLAGMLLGAKWGAISVGVYLAVGLAGFPVFAAGGGISYIFRPSFGYLIGFMASAGLVGRLCESGPGTFRSYFGAAILGMLATYLIGFGYKYLILNLYLGQTATIRAIVAASLALDIPGDTVLCALAAYLAKRLKHVTGEATAA